MLAILFSVAARAQAPLPRTVADVIAQVANAPEPPGAVAAREVLKRAPAAGDTLDSHIARAAAAAELGRTDVLLAERRRIVELTEGERNQPKHLIDLAIVELTAGDWIAAERDVQKAAQSSLAWYGQDVGARALLGRMRSWMGDMSGARTSTQNVESQFAKARLYSGAEPYVELVAALIAWTKADTFLAEGKARQAESALRQAVKHAAADTERAVERANSIERAPAPDVSWQLLDLMEAELARLLAVQGRVVEAEAIARGMVTRNLARYGRDATPTAIALATLGDVLVGQGRWPEAVQVSELATRILDITGTQVASAFSFAARKVRIDALVGEARWHQAADAILDLRSRLAGQGAMLSAAERQGAWALAMLKTKEPTVAAQWLARLHDEQRKSFGENRYETAESLGLLAAAHAASDNATAALDEFLKCVPILIAPANAAAADTENAMRRIKRQAVLLAYIGLLHDLQGGALVNAKGIDAAAEALRIDDAMRGGAVQAALAASAARAMAGTPKLGDLIRLEQDTKRELRILDDRILALGIAPASRERDAALSAARSRAADLEEERRKLLRDVEQQFPSYADLVTPRPAGLAEARKALRPNEALVSIVSAEDRTLVWAVGPGDRFVFRASTLGAPEIDALVAKLRTALDPEVVRLDEIGKIDLRAAHLLYVELLAPTASVWQSAADLTVVDDGSLARIPLAMLPMEPPPASSGETPFEWMKKVAWLARRVSVTNVPSINAFARLRALPASKAERAPFI
ncbi:MAG: hypothetical protein ACM3X5_01875, partial [Bacillota bacterium]